MIKLKSSICVLFGLLILASAAGCGDFKNIKTQVKSPFYQSNIKLPNDFEKYKDAQSYYINVNISTNDVISKISKYKAIILEQLPAVNIDSYNANESSGDLRMSVSPNDAEVVAKIFSNDPEVTQFNKSTSQVGSSYVDAAQNYIVSKALLDSFDDVLPTMKRKSKYNIDDSKFKRMLEDQVRNYESNIREYEKQMNKTSVQIYITKKTADQPK